MKYLLLLCLVSCGVGKNCRPEQFRSQYESTLLVGCGKIKYQKSNGCEISGYFVKDYDNFLFWQVSENECTNQTGEQHCYLAKGQMEEHGNFVCNSLNIKETFYNEGIQK